MALETERDQLSEQHELRTVSMLTGRSRKAGSKSLHLDIFCQLNRYRGSEWYCHSIAATQPYKQQHPNPAKQPVNKQPREVLHESTSGAASHNWFTCSQSSSSTSLLSCTPYYTILCPITRLHNISGVTTWQLKSPSPSNPRNNG